MDNNNNNTKNSTAINLANLKAQFQVDLTSYKQAVADYMAVLQKDSSPYLIIGVGTNGYLYSKRGLDESEGWGLVNDNSSGNIRSVCTGSDGHTIYCTDHNTQILSKSSWDAPTWNLYNTGGGLFKGVAACPDGTLLGVGLDNILYQIRSDGSYTPVNTSESEIGVAIAPDGSVFVCNGAGQVYKKNSYQNLQSQNWQYVPGGDTIIAMTIAPDGTFIGIGTNNYIYSKDSYTDLTPGWKTYYTAGCCVVGVTTVLQNPQMVSTQSQTYWGKGQVGTQGVNTNVTTVDDCVALCSSTSGCSGATFNPTDHGQPMCWLRSGDSDIGPGLYNDYSIVPETKKYLEIMKSINTKLNDTNQQIMDITNGGQGEYAGLTGQSSNNHVELTKNYKVLQKERKKINEMLKKFDDLDESQVETELSINQNYYSFILLSVIAVAICFMLYFFSRAASNPTSVLQTIQQGGKKSASFLFFANIFCAVILILLFIIFIKSGKKLLH
jgi:hypothetical protein